MNKWEHKEARELFSKTVNTLLMRKDKLPTEEELLKILDIAENVVNRAFELFPEEDNNSGGIKDLPIK